MANASRINGFKPVKHLNGSPYNGQANIYEVPAGEAVPVFVGDLVKLSDSAGTAGFPAVEAAVAASSQVVAEALGAVVEYTYIGDAPDASGIVCVFNYGPKCFGNSSVTDYGYCKAPR